jgi:hypothetical protein
VEVDVEGMWRLRSDELRRLEEERRHRDIAEGAWRLEPGSAGVSGVTGSSGSRQLVRSVRGWTMFNEVNP